MNEILLLLCVTVFVGTVAAPLIARWLRKSEAPDPWRISLARVYQHGEEATKALFDTDPKDVIDPDVIPDTFCPGCGATVKQFGPHKCFYCGTALNVRPPKPEHDPVDDSLLYGQYIPHYKTEGIGKMALGNIEVRE